MITGADPCAVTAAATEAVLAVSLCVCGGTNSAVGLCRSSYDGHKRKRPRQRAHSDETEALRRPPRYASALFKGINEDKSMFKVQRMRFCCLGASPRKCVWKITRTLICPLSVFLLRCEMIDAKVVCALQGQQMLSAVTARDTATRAAALFLHSGSTKLIVEELRPFTWAQRSCDLTRGVGGDSQSAAAGVEESAIWNACPWISSMCIGCQGGVQSQWDITWCVRHTWWNWQSIDPSKIQILRNLKNKR